jgi:hypothetical protein
MGRTAVVNHRRGHFQDPARQLTSPASGRAILQAPARAGFPRSPKRNVLRPGAAINRVAKRNRIGDML